MYSAQGDKHAPQKDSTSEPKFCLLGTYTEQLFWAALFVELQSSDRNSHLVA